MSSSMPNLVPVSSESSISSTPQNSASVVDTGSTANSSSRSPYNDVPNDRPYPSNVARMQLYQAMWDPQAGLIASPNTTYIPKNVAHLDSKGDRQRRDLFQPQKLSDQEIYWAFRPRFARNDGPLFGRLNMSHDALNRSIVQLRNGKFILNNELILSWTRLEDALLDVGENLFSAKPFLPRLEYPKFPYELGYRDSHATQEITLRCARRARDAFLDLSAVVSFAISLYMSPAGTVHEAYATVMRRSTFKPARAWFDLLDSSYVCNFSKNFRVGGYIDPYSSFWTSQIHCFVQANVPVWVLWGHCYKEVPPTLQAAYEYLPPDSRIHEAKHVSSISSSLILPIYRYDPFAMGQGQPLSALAPVDKDDPMGSYEYWASEAPVDAPPEPQQEEEEIIIEKTTSMKKAALLALEEHFASLENARKRVLARETPKEKQSREAKEKHAASREMYSKSSRMYQWQEQHDGTYIRVQICSREFDTAWGECTRNQRRYVGHTCTWELCPQLPRYSEEFTKETEKWDEGRSDYESEDEDEDFADFIPPVTKDPSSLQLPAAYQRPDAVTTLTDDLSEPTRQRNALPGEASDSERLTASHTEEFEFANFMKGRFGFDIFSPAGWSNGIEPSDAAKKIKFWTAKMALSFTTVPSGPDVEESIVRLIHTLSNTTLTFRDLPAAFDYANNDGVSIKDERLYVDSVMIGEDFSYIVHERSHIEHSPWGIYTEDASTVLLIFRRKWPTADVIARELVMRGVPFRTVIGTENKPATPPPTPVRGLGMRSKDYKPSAIDYIEYLRRREDVLKGPRGRAALMRGGIVARIARDVLEVQTVLDGPSSSTVSLGKVGLYYLCDDELTADELEIICGVYYVEIENTPVKSSGPSDGQNHANGTTAHMSRWPKDRAWASVNAYIQTEWTEDAEAFYQKHREVLQQTPEKGLLSASRWKSALKRKNVVTKEIEAGSEHYQAEYIHHCIAKATIESS